MSLLISSSGVFRTSTLPYTDEQEYSFSVTIGLRTCACVLKVCSYDLSVNMSLPVITVLAGPYSAVSTQSDVNKHGYFSFSMMCDPNLH